MSLKRALIIAAFSATLFAPSLAQEDLIGVPGPLTFEGTEFILAWSSHPTPAYYKHEYLPEGQKVESYGQMFMLEVLTDGKTPKTAAADMVTALEQRRGTDPVLNYDIIENAQTGEVILDFLLSGDASPTIVVEWNAYRYVPRGDGLVLYAISRRGYGDGAAQFIKALGSWRMQAINALASMDVPEPKLD